MITTILATSVKMALSIKGVIKMNYEKGEKLKDINELLDILKERKAYYCGNRAYTVSDEGYWTFNIRTWQTVFHAIPKKEKKKYYKAWYKLEENYTLEVPPYYFECIEDFKVWLKSDMATRFCKQYGLTNEFIEV